MEPRVCITDWRNPAGPLFDKTRKADLWSLYWTATEASTQGIVGKKIIAWQPGLLRYANGSPVNSPYNNALYNLAAQYRALTGIALHESPDGGWLELLDLTARGFAAAWAGLCVRTFGFADGYHLDYWWSGIVPPTSQEKWEQHMSAFAAILRLQDPNAIIVGQNDRLLGGTWSATSGCYLEQSPYFNGRSLLDHESDIDTFNDTIQRVYPGRELVSICEVREPAKWDMGDLAVVYDWAASNGLYVSAGRNATALGAAK